MYKTFFSIFTILFLNISEINADENIIKKLKEGGNIIFIRKCIEIDPKKSIFLFRKIT